MFKLTFNKPSVKMFFLGEDATGIKIKIDGHKVFFKPVSIIEDTDTDVVAITDKERGGKEAVIEGSQSGTLLQLLTNPLGYPYFLLKRTTGGWMEAVPHTGPRYAPERWEAHIRVWPREAVPAKPVDETLNLHEGNANFAQPDLPPSERIFETLRLLENRARGLTKASPNDAFAAIHDIESLAEQARQIYAQHPFPNQKERKPRTVKPRPTAAATTAARTAAQTPFRRIRDRAFGIGSTAAHAR